MGTVVLPLKHDGTAPTFHFVTDVTRVNSLQVFVPESANDALHIAQTPKKKDDNYHKQFEKLRQFWDALEEPLISSGLVQEIGICDIETLTLQKLHDEASLKPFSVMVKTEFKDLES